MVPEKTSIAELKASDLQARLGLSRSYACELVNRKRTPSLDIAVKIENEFGVPAADWIQDDGRPSQDAAA